MLITDYTTYDEVKSTLGLSIDELPDAILELELYANSLETELDAVTLTNNAPGPGPLKARFLVIKAISAVTRTEAQQSLYNYTRLFATYAVAFEVATSLSMRAPKSVSDSKVTLTRFAPENTWRDVIKDIKAKLKGIKARIEALGTESTGLGTYIKAVVPAYDPVTGA